MRIIAGTKRGMHLFTPDTRETRPITDRVKESLFMVLHNYDLLAGARVADLFCGVGSLGLEAISRGAASVTFVEKSAEILAVLEKNIAKAAFGDRARVVRDSAFRVGAPLGPKGERYDLVFVDPPYTVTQDVGEGSTLADLLRILQNQVVPKGVVIVRTRRDCPPLDDYGPFHAVDRREWGTMSVVLLQARADEQPASGH
ncbi:MAG TPA: 16S rRNA (guanine(966)-N(2))-methyltransferase RsmD [Sedimentisphaerales bacterium]|jgi:16S rRNA (guanine966-N2)-methyltransferase|nr:16S rRNA (guanine(966)-N(2))-methyltransferase RsmD [Sedimentisphaerales bacterium]HNU27911.1 16S rRNA (guanine(966)-N(2))-methyltransferase RsmD [Sedimentisphaerales bacterium]